MRISVHSLRVKALALGHSSLKCPCPWHLKHITSFIRVLVLYFDTGLGLLDLGAVLVSTVELRGGLSGLERIGVFTLLLAYFSWIMALLHKPSYVRLGID